MSTSELSTMQPLHKGGKSEAARALQVATNKRLRSRGITSLVTAEDGVIGARTIAAVRKAAWALGAATETCDKIAKTGEIPIGVQRLIRNPGKRSPEQQARGAARIAKLRAARKRRAEEAKRAGAKRRAIVREAKKAAANYRKNPGAYHYSMPGVANTEYLKPTPRNWRSDCSQFAAAVYKGAGCPSPGNVDYKWVGTNAMMQSPHARVTMTPKPGCLGMYGTRTSTHHVEIYIGEPGCEFIGHGSPPIDSVTPGRPDFYLDFDFLN
jgi:hypothetical protein